MTYEADLNLTRPPAPAIPLKGYLIREESEQIWVVDQQGTWIINVSDLTGRGEWSGVIDNRFSGSPGIFYIRDGAEIKMVRTVKIKASLDWPLAIAANARESQEAGDTAVDMLVQNQLSVLGIRDLIADRRTVYTYCKGPDGKKYICDNAAV
jgi:hypothetical protein